MTSETHLLHPGVSNLLRFGLGNLSGDLLALGRKGEVEVKKAGSDDCRNCGHWRYDSTFGRKFERLGKKDEWQEIKIPLSGFVYWWGGDSLNAFVPVKTVKSFWIAVSKNESGSGKFWIRDLSISSPGQQARKE